MRILIAAICFVLLVLFVLRRRAVRRQRARRLARQRRLAEMRRRRMIDVVEPTDSTSHVRVVPISGATPPPQRVTPSEAASRSGQTPQARTTR